MVCTFSKVPTINTHEFLILLSNDAMKRRNVDDFVHLVNDNEMFPSHKIVAKGFGISHKTTFWSWKGSGECSKYEIFVRWETPFCAIPVFSIDLISFPFLFFYFEVGKLIFLNLFLFFN